ncbi:MAG TPA: type IV pilus twitching motility protein PilT [Firmicutes bacterium]|nr:type IV pilus twitching motility protein PilT [Candidatus Fermentithermobacillaceae bacterium]
MSGVDLRKLLSDAVAQGASDVHLTVGSPPIFRIADELVQSSQEILQASDTEALALSMMDPDLKRKFEAHGHVDFSYDAGTLTRLRVNVYRQRDTVAIALRLIPLTIPSLSELGLPPVVSRLCQRDKGLILITGPSGSGKSTTLAAMVEHINSSVAKHIITIEDPIEYVYVNRKSIIQQREVGRDTGSFAAALKAALREDPDVIVVGELRDLESISTALVAAETGHLVMGTLHSPSAPGAIDRMIGVFPPHQQGEARYQLASVLEAVIAQKLYKRQDRRGLVPAVEVLLATVPVRNLIREGKTHQLVSVMQLAGRSGMRTMDSSVRELVDRGIISSEEYESSGEEAFR